MEIHVVRAGESLWSIARRNNTTVDTLARINQLNDPARLTRGMAILVPGESSTPRGSMEVNGYAYPGMTTEVLAQTLPYLSYISPFAYSASATGALNTLDDGPMLAAVSGSATGPLMTVTNLDEVNGGFSSAVAHALFNDAQAREALVGNVIALAQSKGYFGVNFDFEYVYSYDREAYNEFLRYASERLHAQGLFMTTAVAPKSSDDQQGLLYAAHDYAAHGQYADRVIIMTYEWGYTYGQPQAVSPVNKMRTVLDYAVTRIPAGKILMGFSNYGYSWRIPWRQGEAAQAISNAAAVNLAVSTGSEVRFDEQAAAPYFFYTDAAGQQHEVWFEDARSVRARLRLVNEYGLAGISIWTINRLNRGMLALINAEASVEKPL